MGFITYAVKNIYEYIELMERINNTQQELWFRGQSNATYRLSPSCLREVYAIEDWMGRRINPPKLESLSSASNNEVAYLPVPKMVEEFKKKASKCITYTVNNDIEWECIAQHYGLPTRMLDWTTNPLDALYFATSDCQIGGCNNEDIEWFMTSGFSKGGGAVFAIDPLEINKETAAISGDYEPFVLDPIKHEELISNHLNSEFPPVCIDGPINEKRICRQSGHFSTTGTLVWPMDFYQVLQDKIIKIFIPYNAYSTIRNQLRSIGITHESIYINKDEKDCIAEKIAQETKKEFRDHILNMYKE